jgi:hypothetical protein
MATKRRTRAGSRRPKSKRGSGSVASTRRRIERERDDLQRHVLRVFDEQADTLWARLAHHCREFASGFNQAVGSPALLVDADATTLRVAYPRAESELRIQLDKSDRLLLARLNLGCDDASVCTACSPALPVGLTVSGNQLQLVLRGDITADEQVAVTLLTELTNGTLE